jgi:hypothetical protein
MPWLYRGKSIPVNIIQEGSTTAASDSKYSAKGGEKSSLAPPAEKKVPNAFLSGDYVILGINIEFNLTDRLHQVLILGKKQWVLNPGIASDPSTVDPTSDEGDFNDLTQNTSSITQKDAGVLNNSVF